MPSRSPVAASDDHFEGKRALAAALFRAGRLGDAIPRLEAAQSGGPAHRSPAEEWLLALAHRKRDRPDEAWRWLEKGARQPPLPFPAPEAVAGAVSVGPAGPLLPPALLALPPGPSPSAVRELGWHGWVEARLLHAEALAALLSRP